MKNSNDAITISNIIAQTKRMELRYSMSFCINALIYMIGIYFLIKYKIFYWQFYIFIFMLFISTTSLTYHLFNAINKLWQKKQDEKTLIKEIRNLPANEFLLLKEFAENGYTTIELNTQNRLKTALQIEEKFKIIKVLTKYNCAIINISQLKILLKAFYFARK